MWLLIHLIVKESKQYENILNDLIYDFYEKWNAMINKIITCIIVQEKFDKINIKSIIR